MARDLRVDQKSAVPGPYLLLESLLPHHSVLSRKCRLLLYLHLVWGLEKVTKVTEAAGGSAMKRNRRLTRKKWGCPLPTKKLLLHLGTPNLVCSPSYFLSILVC